MYKLVDIMKALGCNQIRIMYDVNNKMISFVFKKISLYGKTCFDVSKVTVNNGEVEFEFIDFFEISAIETTYRNIKAKHSNVSVTFK